jgi:hypothetical protein
MIQITEASKSLFTELADDAGNWSGQPLIGGNVELTKEERGNLTHLKKLNLIATFNSDGDMFVSFTAEGVAYAKSLGIDLTPYYPEYDEKEGTDMNPNTEEQNEADRNRDDDSRVHEFFQVKREFGGSDYCAKCGEHRDEGVHDAINIEKQPLDPCSCGPEDGDYGSGYHFQSCPRYAPYRRPVRAASGLTYEERVARSRANWRVEHQSPCVHRAGSDHRGAECGVCERGDCDDVEDFAAMGDPDEFVTTTVNLAAYGELLAVMKAARAFVSLSPSHPDSDRLRTKLADAVFVWNNREAGDSVPGSGTTEVVIDPPKFAQPDPYLNPTAYAAHSAERDAARRESTAWPNPFERDVTDR